MPKGFQKIRFNVEEKKDEELRDIGTLSLTRRGIGRARSLDEDARTFTSDEAAARFYVGKVLSRDDRPSVRSLSSPARPEVMPDMRLRGSQQVPSSTDRLVSFDQTHADIPVFGSRVVVQLDRNRELVNIGGDMADIKGVPPVASLSPAEAMVRVAEVAGVQVAALGETPPPTLTFFHDDKDEWHLAYLCTKVPAAPPDFVKGATSHKGHGLGRSPRQLRPSVNYVIDAHDGAMLLYYSAAPTAAVEVPCECIGDGELGGGLKFFGRKLPDGFEMVDPWRSIKTYDMEGKDIDADPVPKKAIKSTTNNWQASKAAVSAHVNATTVYNFYKSVLLRDGVDDKGMDLVSIVNCTYSHDQPPPEWHNAVWYENKMWYGQDAADDGTLRSFSRYLDIIAHELTHGVTEYTSNLVYLNQSGALNESFSDIFGIIIANWNPKDPERDVGTWTWQLGAGLGQGGLPLRDLADPAVTNDPAHMDDYLQTNDDFGGVHTNSNIHNKAAYNLLTATDLSGKRVFRPMEAAELFYLTLSRLSSVATFSDTMHSMVDVASIYYAGDAQKRADRIQHIKNAYSKVGIN